MRDNDYTKRLDRMLKDKGMKPMRLEDLLKAPQAEQAMPMPPLPKMDVLRNAGAIPVEENSPQPEVGRQAAPKAQAKPADDAAPPAPMVPEVVAPPVLKGQPPAPSKQMPAKGGYGK